MNALSFACTVAIVILWAFAPMPDLRAHFDRAHPECPTERC